MRVLIVEDDPNVGELLTRYFESIACEVALATSVDGALVLISKTDPPKLVTLDLNLGPGGERETLSRINELKARCPEAVVIVLSGVIDPTERQRVLDAGADGFIHKNEMALGRANLMGKIIQILSGILSRPGRYARNIPIVEEMAKRFTDWVKEQTKS